MAEPIQEDFAEMINAAAGEGWARAMGIRIVRATREEVAAEIPIQACHLQAYGIVHGGVYSGIIETLASIGAAIHAMPEGKTVVGLENHTSFLRAVREGTLHAVATPLSRGGGARCGSARSATTSSASSREGACACSRSTPAPRWPGRRWLSGSEVVKMGWVRDQDIRERFTACLKVAR